MPTHSGTHASPRMVSFHSCTVFSLVRFTAGEGGLGRGFRERLWSTVNQQQGRTVVRMDANAAVEETSFLLCQLHDVVLLLNI